MLSDDADDMEAICDDLGSGKVSSNQAAVRTFAIVSTVLEKADPRSDSYSILRS